MTEHGPRGCSKSFRVSGEFREILEQRPHAADAVFEWLPPDRPEADGDVPGIARTAHWSRWLAKFLGKIGWTLRTIAIGSGTAARLLDGSVGVSGSIGYKLCQPRAGLGSSPNRHEKRRSIRSYKSSVRPQPTAKPKRGSTGDANS